IPALPLFLILFLAACNALHVTELNGVGGHFEFNVVRKVGVRNMSKDRVVFAGLFQGASSDLSQFDALLASDEDKVMSAGVEVGEIEEVRASLPGALFVRRFGDAAGPAQQGAGAK